MIELGIEVSFDRECPATILLMFVVTPEEAVILASVLAVQIQRRFDTLRDLIYKRGLGVSNGIILDNSGPDHGFVKNDQLTGYLRVFLKNAGFLGRVESVSVGRYEI